MLRLFYENLSVVNLQNESTTTSLLVKIKDHLAFCHSDSHLLARKRFLSLILAAQS